MAVLFLLSPLLLLLLGTAAGQAVLEEDPCLLLGNVTEGNFTVETDPDTYQPNTTYLVTIKDDRNHSGSSGRLLLHAVSPQNDSVGRWEEGAPGNCSFGVTAVLNITKSTARWTSPDSNSTLSSVHIRVYLILPGNSTELKIHILDTGAQSTTSPSTTTPNSVCRAQSSSLLLLPVLLLLLTGTLLS